MAQTKGFQNRVSWISREHVQKPLALTHFQQCQTMNARRVRMERNRLPSSTTQALGLDRPSVPAVVKPSISAPPPCCGKSSSILSLSLKSAVECVAVECVAVECVLAASQIPR
eukprot:TRINITY_DN15758_c0_g1_i1.p2 TRINITY_DN15758_c0_g1~~TRINITY_DN15758_c0_g1_i1.p2  ORF type:complete len:126 (-),score=11.49 TRINITY_DN15758_c0_g1_i1:134-472(-)